MARRRGAAQLYLAQAQRERNRRQRQQRQHPEGVHVGEERRLRQHLLSDPGNRLHRRFGGRGALTDEIVRHLVQRVLILDARWQGLVDEPGLMKLLAAPQHVGDQGNADRAAGIARRIDQGRGLAGLVGRDAVKDAVVIETKTSGSPTPNSIRERAMNQKPRSP